MAKPRTDCPDCKGTLEPVRLLGSFSPLHHDVKLSYAPRDAVPGFWTQRTKTSGSLFGQRCRECGRVLLYGQERP